MGLAFHVATSPSYKFRPAPEPSTFLKSISKNALKGIKVADFDTRFSAEEINSTGWFFSVIKGVFGFAADPITKNLEKKRGELVIRPEGFTVDGFEGSLTECELE